MTLILWAGKNGEMMFNRRRCSQDRAVIADILAQFHPSALSVSAYSAPLFEGARVVSQPADAGDGALFLEDLPLQPALELADKLIVYRFDRVYPANVRLQIPKNFSLTENREFAGYSHEKITREIYEK